MIIDQYPEINGPLVLQAGELSVLTPALQEVLRLPPKRPIQGHPKGKRKQPKRIRHQEKDGVDQDCEDSVDENAGNHI